MWVAAEDERPDSELGVRCNRFGHLFWGADQCSAGATAGLADTGPQAAFGEAIVCGGLPQLRLSSDAGRLAVERAAGDLLAGRFVDSADQVRCSAASFVLGVANHEMGSEPESQIAVVLLGPTAHVVEDIPAARERVRPHQEYIGVGGGRVSRRLGDAAEVERGATLGSLAADARRIELEEPDSIC